MLQHSLLALVLICGTTTAAYSSSQQSTFTGTYGNNNNAQNDAGAAAGAATGSATGGGVYGNYPNGGFNNQHGGNNGNYGGQYPYGNNGGFPQQFPFAGNEQFQQFFNNFWEQFGKNQQNLYQQQIAHQQALFNQFHQFQQQGGNFGAGAGAAGAGSGANGPNGFYAPNFAGSSATYGPGGFHQTASITPANPDSPNVDTRFGGEEKPIVTVSAGPAGFQGVSTSSFSSSSDINGQKTNHREASTSVNDNGKVTTYTVRS